jgi:hypothetical protein
VLRTVGEQPSLWEAMLPEELLVLPAELTRVDALLDDPSFLAPFAGKPTVSAYDLMSRGGYDLMS